MARDGLLANSPIVYGLLASLATCRGQPGHLSCRQPASSS